MASSAPVSPTPRRLRPGDIGPGDLRPGALRPGVLRPTLTWHGDLDDHHTAGGAATAGPALPAQVRATQWRLLGVLALGAGASAWGGVAAWRAGRRHNRAWLRAFGRQSLAWAAVDAGVVAWGLSRPPALAADADAARATARKLTVLTGVNAMADVGYVAAAVAAGRRWPARRADAAAVVVQAAFLAWLDVRFSRQFFALARRES